MKDVAREANVALGTVSKVFNGMPVGERYRLRVEEAAKKLGYQVNQYARGLKTNKTYVVAVILPNVCLPFFARMTQFLCAALARRGYQMQLYLTDFDPETEQKCMRTIRQHKVDGIIGLVYNPDLEINENIPFVTIDRSIRGDIPCVSSDNYIGGWMQAEKLMSLGCRKLAFLRSGSLDYGETDKRVNGFEAACRSHRADYEVCWLSEGEGLSLFEDFFKKHITDGRLDIDGIGCSTDLLVYQVTRILTRLGCRVPDDVQIVGYDGLRKFGSEEYTCSTIIQPTEQIAETCVDMVLSPEKGHGPSLVCLPVTYAPGGTTKE